MLDYYRQELKRVYGPEVKVTRDAVFIYLSFCQYKACVVNNPESSKVAGRNLEFPQSTSPSIDLILD